MLINLFFNRDEAIGFIHRVYVLSGIHELALLAYSFPSAIE